MFQIRGVLRAAAVATVLGLVAAFWLVSSFGITGTAQRASAAATSATTAVPSAAGQYDGTFFFVGGRTIRDRSMQLVLSGTSHGTFVISQHGPAGTWSQKAAAVVMKGMAYGTNFAFRAELTGSDLGSAKHPGSIDVEGNQVGTWYAVRTS